MRISGFQLKLPVFRQSMYPIFFFSGLLLALFSSTESIGQGNLLISPLRIVFDGSKKTKELNLANTGKDTARYLVSIMEIRMTEDGRFEEIVLPDSGQNFASKFLRFFPRSVVLAPNEAQTVKVQLTKADQLTPGEYRSHIYFRAVPNPKPLGEINAPTAKDSSIKVEITPVFGITVPVIIRLGESTAQVSLSDVSVTVEGDTLPKLNLVFHRQGNMSVYGNITVEHISASGKTTPVGVAKGIAVYTPNLIRRFQFDLNKTPVVDYHSGKLRVTYTENTIDPKPKKFAEIEVPLHK